MESKSDSSKAPGKTIQFYPFSTIIDSSFWIELRRLKLDQLKLDSSPVVISPVFSTSRANSHLVQLNYESFQEQQRSPRNLDCAEHYLRGKLIVFNTKSDFDQVDKRALIGSTGLEIWNALCDQTVDRNLDHHLCPFLMIVFGDLKSYCFHYWCAYPALAFPPNILNIAHKPFAEHFSQSQLQSITNQLSSNRNLFFPIIENQSVKLTSFDCFWSLENIESITESQVLFAFEDPSPSGEYPGWPLRNYICYVHKRLEQLKRKYSQNSSVQKFVNKLEECALFASIRSHTVNKSVDKCSIYQLRIWNKENVSLPPVVGWERNKTANNQLVANYVDCSSILNPEVLCRDALHLNLKLMKWRLAPSLDLELIRDTRCLLLGAGTLGCNVARSLVAWGINRITFVDNRNVSYSNPSRQTLYTFRDAIGGNKSKAKTAAEALKLIQPTIESEGFDLNIKMPGHCSNDVESDRKDVELLERLVDEHDVLFLLTDTRESRWLPTVIAASKHKIVLNVALGFDTFLVQRHGMRLRTGNSLDQQSPLYSLFEAQLKLKQKLSSSNPTMPFYLGSELGCYYCNDVFAPGNVRVLNCIGFSPTHANLNFRA